MELFKRIRAALRLIVGKPFIFIEVGKTLKLTANVSDEIKTAALSSALGKQPLTPKQGERISLHELQEMLGVTTIQVASNSNTQKNTYSLGLKRLTLTAVDNVIVTKSGVGHRCLKNILVNIVG